ncbi:MAG: hypothetical protein AAFY06_16675 [Pseudomonadota bacterium]
MKAILAALFATVVIAVGANLILSQAGFSAKEQTSGASVRLD